MAHNNEMKILLIALTHKIVRWQLSVNYQKTLLFVEFMREILVDIT